MGRGGPKAQGGGKPSQSWGYWPGTWRSPRSRGREWENWQQEPEVPAFPSYDGKPRAIALKREAQADTARKLPSAAETEEDPGGMLTTELQDFVNLARKAEQRVRSLTAARKQKDTLWAKWQEEMKQAYLKETMRYEKAVETLERDLQHALAAREDARQNIREYVQRGGMPREEDAGAMEELDWDSMTSQWKREQKETDAPQAVLNRALQPAPAGLPTGPQTAGQGGLMTQEAAARLHGHRRQPLPSGCRPLGACSAWRCGRSWTTW